MTVGFNEISIYKPNKINNNSISMKELQDFYEGIDVVDETINTYKKGINNFIVWVNNNNKRYINKEILQDYKKYLINNFENTTAYTYFSGVRNLFRFLEDYGVYNPTKNIKSIKISKEFKKLPLTKEQANKIKNYKAQNLNTLKDKRDYALYCLLLYNGLREIEVSRLNKEDFVCENGKYVLKIQGKGKLDKTQTAVLTDSVLIPLLDYLDKRGNDNIDTLFIGLSSNNYGTRLTTRSIRRIISNLLIKNGYKSKYITTHSLRHTACTSALLAGADLQETQELARHSDINTTEIYAHNIDRITNPPEYYVERYLNS